VVQLRAPHVAALGDLDLGDVRRVDREGALHANAERHLAHREGLADATTVAGQHDALEDLHALAVAFDDADMHLDRVSWPEARDVVPQRLSFQRVQGVHRLVRPRARIRATACSTVDAGCLRIDSAPAARWPRAATSQVLQT